MKKAMKEHYRFVKLLSDKEIDAYFSGRPVERFVLVAMLNIGYVKIELSLWPGEEPGNVCLDLMVKDRPDSRGWICYDCFSLENKLFKHGMESAMFRILDQKVREYGLSYTECNFEMLRGTSPKKD